MRFDEEVCVFNKFFFWSPWFRLGLNCAEPGGELLEKDYESKESKKPSRTRNYLHP